MVNHSKGKEYEPVPFYNRKLVRSILRAKAEKKHGFHRVSAQVHDAFEVFRNLGERA